MKDRSDVAGFIKAFTGSHIYIAEYLVEEVLQRQPDEVQRFLLQTSILERINPALCEAVTGCESGQSMLTALQRANLFIISMDDEGWWFRYHQLFADLLRVRLRQAWSPDVIAGLRLRAAGWYARSGMVPEAIKPVSISCSSTSKSTMYFFAISASSSETDHTNLPIQGYFTKY